MDEKDIVDWSPQKFLNWDDFKAEPNPALYQDAYSKIHYAYTWTLKSEKMGSDVFFYIDKIYLTTQFLKHLSWVRPKLATEQLLRHQQGFFDLAEELRPKITQLLEEKLAHKRHPTSGKNEEESKQYARENSGMLIKTELDRLYHDVFLSGVKTYESDTEYGENTSKQEEYDRRFEKLRK